MTKVLQKLDASESQEPKLVSLGTVAVNSFIRMLKERAERFLHHRDALSVISGNGYFSSLTPSRPLFPTTYGQ
jgi:hypothetical protein